MPDRDSKGKCRQGREPYSDALQCGSYKFLSTISVHFVPRHPLSHPYCYLVVTKKYRRALLGHTVARFALAMSFLYPPILSVCRFSVRISSISRGKEP